MNSLIIAIIMTTISIILILHFYRRFKFEKIYSKKESEGWLQRVNNLEFKIEKIENEQAVDKQILTSLFAFLEGKETFKIYQVTLPANLGDIAIVTTSKTYGGSYTLFELFSFRFGGIVAYCDVGLGGFHLHSNPPKGHYPIRGHNESEYTELGFGTIIMKRVIEYCSVSGMTELRDVMMMPRNEKHDKRLKSFFKNLDFSNPEGRRIIRDIPTT